MEFRFARKLKRGAWGRAPGRYTSGLFPGPEESGLSPSEASPAEQTVPLVEKRPRAPGEVIDDVADRAELDPADGFARESWASPLPFRRNTEAPRPDCELAHERPFTLVWQRERLARFRIKPQLASADHWS